MLPDLGWTEFLVIGIVLIVVIGPKDLPRVIKGFGKGMKSVRKMSSDFQKQFSDAMDEAEMSELRDMAREVKGLDPRNQIKDALNPLGKIGDDISSDIKRAVDGSDVSVPNTKLGKPDSAVDQAMSTAGAKAKAAQPVKSGATGMPVFDEAARATGRPKETEPKPAVEKPDPKASKPPLAKARSETAGKGSTSRKPANKPKQPAKPKPKTAAKATAKPASKTKDVNRQERGAERGDAS